MRAEKEVTITITNTIRAPLAAIYRDLSEIHRNLRIDFLCETTSFFVESDLIANSIFHYINFFNKIQDSTLFY